MRDICILYFSSRPFWKMGAILNPEVFWNAPVGQKSCKGFNIMPAKFHAFIQKMHDSAPTVDIAYWLLL